MITYVNTVLVGTGVGTIASSIAAASKGQFVVMNMADGKLITTAAQATTAEAIKIGMATGKSVKYIVNDAEATTKEIKWSHVIKKNDVKSYHKQTYAADTEDVATITFNSAALVAGNRIVVRLTFKDTDTRYRKWSESYEHVVEAGKATASDVVSAFVKQINVKNAKRARVVASGTSTLILTAMPYDDDDTVDSISPANKVRFNANAWYTDPSAQGFASKNKYNAATIEKTPGKTYTASAKLVRDAEAQAMGYDGILNRGEGTWPIVKPGMNVDLDAHYDTFTLEFENMYRTADDLQRRTKNTVQVYDVTTKLSSLETLVEAFVKGAASAIEVATNDVDVETAAAS